MKDKNDLAESRTDWAEDRTILANERTFAGWMRTGMACGVLLYAGVGIAALLMGGNYLDYSVLHHGPVHGQHLGITLIEFGVGTTVACVMVTVFYTFARWKG